MARYPLMLAALAVALAPPAVAKKRPPEPAPVGTLIDNIVGETPDGNGGIDRFEAMLIDTDGRIIAVYHKGESRPARVAYRLDGGGRVVVPGFIDSHARVMDTGFARITLDLSAAGSLAEALSRITAWSAAHPDAPWVLGQGWDDSGWADGTPTAAALDAATGSRPAWLVRSGGDAGWASSAALTAAGIGDGTADPAGGRIERIAGSRRASGLLVGTAAAIVEAKAPHPRPEDRDTAFAEAQLAFLRAGTTTVADMGTTIEDWQSWRRAADRGDLRLRLVAYAASVNDMTLIGGPGPSPWLYDDRLKMNGLHIMLDGAVAVAGAWLAAPYADAPGSKGLPRMNGTQLGNLMSRAAIDNFQVAVTAQGDEAVATLLDTVTDLAQTYKGDRRWRLEGAEVLSAGDVERLAGSGIVVSMQPRLSPEASARYQRQLGAERRGTVQAWRSVTERVALPAFGSGSPPLPSAPFATFALTTTRPEQALSREAALTAPSAAGARALFAEDRLGRLAKGYRADFLFVDRDPLLAPADQLAGIRVLETWIGGKLAWSAAPATPASKDGATAPPR
ncbi:amidohydrolase [Novosphingobium colocasiae]|uniref:Amidohydrolase n=1 Tax=Novosphingobium colocasiae TaxID=1256513 RepID=A0A918PEW2_9SPHN|nr:amidohydrolase [Novosphingobium colocasiae]GGZ04618.1 amidohydrolase [Novosphingobium colocasiae]